MGNKKLLGYIKLIAVILIWGGVYHVAKYVVEDTDIFTISFLRFLFASSILLAIYFGKHGREKGLNTFKRYWKILLVIGGFGIFIYNILFFGAEALISANSVAILYALTPCITVLLGSMFLKQRINFLGYIGIIVALLGTVGVISLSDANCGRFFCKNSFNNFSLGQIFALLASFTMAIYSLLVKKATQIGADSLTITTFGTFIGAVCLLFTFIFFGSGLTQLLHKHLGFWLAIIYLSVFATVICYKWYSDALKEIGVSKTVVFQNGVPLFAVITGMVLLGDKISSGVLISGTIIIVGVLITNFAVSKGEI